MGAKTSLWQPGPGRPRYCTPRTVLAPVSWIHITRTGILRVSRSLCGGVGGGWRGGGALSLEQHLAEGIPVQIIDPVS